MSKVCLIGTGERSMYDAPYMDDSWDVWATGTCYTYLFQKHPEYIDHVNKFFEMHKDYSYVGEAYGAFVSAYKDSFYTQETYPLEDVQQFFSADNYCNDEFSRKFDYFTSTVSYMLALAIQQGYTEIALYGIDMAHDGEYAIQRPSAEYFIGYARGRGIKVIIPDKCDMLKSAFMYGYAEEDVLPEVFTSKYEEIQAKLQSNKENIYKYLISGGQLTDTTTGQLVNGFALLNEKIYLDGSADMAKYYAKQWGNAK